MYARTKYQTTGTNIYLAIICFNCFSSVQNINENQWNNPGFEPGTFGLLVRCSTDWADDSDGEDQWFKSADLQFNPVPLISSHSYEFFFKSILKLTSQQQRLKHVDNYTKFILLTSTTHNINDSQRNNWLTI